MDMRDRIKMDVKEWDLLCRGRRNKSGWVLTAENGVFAYLKMSAGYILFAAETTFEADGTVRISLNPVE